MANKSNVMRRILSVICILAMALGVFMFGGCDGKKAEKPLVPEAGNVYDMPKAMVLTERAAPGLGRITLRATVLPENAVNKNLIWGVSFVNPASSWAEFKNVADYLTVTPSADTQTATVTCLEAFCEQIRITVTSEYDSTKSATCTVDFMRKVSSVFCSYAGVSGNGIYTLPVISDKDSLSTQIYPNTSYNKGDGTVDASSITEDLRLNWDEGFESEFEAYMAEKGLSQYVDASSSYKYIKDNGLKLALDKDNTAGAEYPALSKSNDFISRLFGYDTTAAAGVLPNATKCYNALFGTLEYKQVIDFLEDYYGTTREHPIAWISYTVTAGSASKSTKVGLDINPDGIGIAVQSVSVSDNTYIF